MHTYIHTYIHSFIYVVHTHTHTPTHPHPHPHTHTHTHTHRWGHDDDYAAEVARKEHEEEENIKQKLAKDDTDSEKVGGGQRDIY